MSRILTSASPYSSPEIERLMAETTKLIAEANRADAEKLKALIEIKKIEADELKLQAEAMRAHAERKKIGDESDKIRLERLGYPLMLIVSTAAAVVGLLKLFS